MNPLFIYKRQPQTTDLFDLYLVRSSMEIEPPYEEYKLVASIEGRTWLQSFLNYAQKDRNRMLRELEDGN